MKKDVIYCLIITSVLVVLVVALALLTGCYAESGLDEDAVLASINVWICLGLILLAIFVNFFVNQWLLNFVIVFMCIYMITTNTNEWLAWVGGLIAVWNALSGIFRVYRMFN